MEETKNKVITIEQGQALLNYLGMKPYAEVYKLIQMLMTLPDEKPQVTENKTE